MANENDQLFSQGTFGADDSYETPVELGENAKTILLLK